MLCGAYIAQCANPVAAVPRSFAFNVLQGFGYCFGSGGAEMRSSKRLLSPRIRPPFLCGLLAGLTGSTASNAQAADYYVATTGSDANVGSLSAPFATLQKGADVA